MTNIGRRSIVADHPDRAAIGDDLIVSEVRPDGIKMTRVGEV